MTPIPTQMGHLPVPIPIREFSFGWIIIQVGLVDDSWGDSDGRVKNIACHKR